MRRKIQTRRGAAVYTPLVAGLALTCAAAANADRTGPAVPFTEGAQPTGEYTPPQGGIAGSSIGLKAAADNILAQQCPNGGFNWPYGGCANTYSNITAPITMGLLRAYAITGDANYLQGAIEGGNHDLAATWSYGGVAVSSFDPIWFVRMSDATGDSSWVDTMKDDFFDRLTDGTYGDGPGSCGGTDWLPGTTHDYLARHKCARSGSGINYRPWDMQYMPLAASLIGNSDSAPGDGISQMQTFINDSVLDGLATLVRDQQFDLLGLAGGVHGLALVNHSSFAPLDAPDFAEIDGIDNLCDLADILAAYQNADGSWSWRSDLQDAGGASPDSQTTAFAILALIAAQNAGCGPYDDAVTDARNWLWSMQDSADGAFLSHPGGDKNIEVQGEVLMALGFDTALTINADQTCYNNGIGDTVTVTVDMSEMPGIEIVGAQLFLNYDDAVLQLDSVTPGPDFGLEILECHGLYVAGTCIPTTGSLAYGVGIDVLGDPGAQGTSGPATIATLTFTALAEVCDVADLVTFDLSGVSGPNKLSDAFAGVVMPDLNDLGEVTIDSTAPTFVTFPDDAIIECNVSEVQIAGTHLINSSYRNFAIEHGVLFEPQNGPVRVAGDADITDLLGTNSSLFFGLIAKHRFDEWNASSYGPYQPNTFFGFMNTAYGVYNSGGGGGGGRLAMGQQIGSSGELAGTYIIQGIGGVASGIDLTIGPGGMAMEYGANSGTQNYSNNLYDFLTGTNGHATDWGDGAYAFVGTFVSSPNRTTVFDFTFSQNLVPQPDVTGEPTVSDNCDGDPVVTFNDVITDGACPQSMTIERTWTVTDACGNSHSDVQIIEVVDTTAPSITCPDDIVMDADVAGCSAAVALATGWEPDVNAAIVETGDPTRPWAAQLRSVSGDPEGPWGPTGALVWTPDSPMTFADITELSAEFNMLEGCIVGGSPRFSIGIDSDGDGEVDGNVFAHFGPEGNPWNHCPGPGWNSTGDLTASADSRWEGAQLGGDTTMTYAEVAALVNGLPFSDVKYVIIALDGHWSQDQIMLVDNVVIGSTSHTFGGATADDNCDSDVVIVGERDDAQPLDAPYPAGVTTITWTATDCSGNFSTCEQTVTVNPVNTLAVDVELEGVNEDVDRCITFDFDGPDGPVSVSEVLSFVGGVASAEIAIPCGLYDCVTVRDELHTLARSQSLVVDDGVYSADFTGGDALVGGNLNDDEFVDILDFGVFAWQYGEDYGSGDTTCATAYPHADVSGNGLVAAEDFTFIQINFLEEGDYCVTMLAAVSNGSSTAGRVADRTVSNRKPLERISVRELRRRGLDRLAAADLNKDGMVDQIDIVLFLNGVQP